MIDAPYITQTVAQPISFIRLMVPCEEIRNVMVPGRQELMDVVAAEGIVPAGPWFTHNL
jgi:hypothetical protein